MTLRAVEPGEKPQKRLTVEEAAAQGEHRELLVALRARIAKSVGAANCSPVALTALSRQLVLISKELSVLDSSAERTLSGRPLLPRMSRGLPSEGLR
jgi:uncharacterized protein HemY